MKSSTHDVTPDQAATGAPTAGNARRTTLTRIARLARVIAEIAAEILVGFPGC